MGIRTTLKSDPYNDPEGDGMEFRLTYDGLLLGSSRTDTRAKHKHELRKSFHGQLRQFWEAYEPLRLGSPRTFVRHSHMHETTTIHPGTLSEYLANKYPLGRYRFVPLVRESLSLICSLNVLFLRPDRPGAVLQSGDIDNRLKTLFDALRLPHSNDELGGWIKPDPGEDPFYVLMEDDRLITHVAVETDMLFAPRDERLDPNYSRLVITVKIRPYDANPANALFG